MVELMNSKQLVHLWWSTSSLRRSLRKEIEDSLAGALMATTLMSLWVLHSAERQTAWAPARSLGMPKWDQYNEEQTGALCCAVMEKEAHTHTQICLQGFVNRPSAPGQTLAWMCISTKPPERKPTAESRLNANTIQLKWCAVVKSLC